MPAEYSHTSLLNDYGRMKDMIYGAYPPWDEILAGLKSLEVSINGRHV